MEDIRKELASMEREMVGIKSKVDSIHTCIIGSDLGKDGGLVQRLVDVEDTQNALDKRLSSVESKSIKQSIRVNILWAILGTTAGLIIAYIIQSIVYHK